MTLHWIRQQTLTAWLHEHGDMLHHGDALLLTDHATEQLPQTPPCRHAIYVLEAEVTAQRLPDYITRLDDAQWLQLVLEYDHQITW